MEINPYLSFNGHCEAAFGFYEQCLGATSLSFHRYAGSPMADQVPSEWHDKVMHATLVVGNTALMGADTPSSHYEGVKGCSISLSIDKPEDADRVFNALAEGATVQMPIQQTFWTSRFGMLVDRFGIPWMVNCNQPPS
ncbi:MAG: VOC family protein [Pedosphaera sp.]|nr:VOC family protein [Pedosphaera sp.]